MSKLAKLIVRCVDDARQSLPLVAMFGRKYRDEHNDERLLNALRCIERNLTQMIDETNAELTNENRKEMGYYYEIK